MKKRLCQLYLAWEPKVKNIPVFSQTLPEWGLSLDDIEEAHHEATHGAWDFKDALDSDEDSDSGDDEENGYEVEEDDAEIIEDLEEQILHDAYRSVTPEMDSYSDIQEYAFHQHSTFQTPSHHSSGRSRSPQKRARADSDYE